MSKRGANLLLAIMALVLGGLVYVLLRPTTMVGAFAGRIPGVSQIQTFFQRYELPFLSCYFVDFLWGLSLSSGLMAMHNPGKKGAAACAVTAFGWGCLWEILQRLEMVSGTGDLRDIFMYFLAAGISILVNLKERKL